MAAPLPPPVLPALCAVSIVVSACVSTAFSASDWQAFSLGGAVLILEHTDAIEEIRFLGNKEGGWAVVTLGKKSGPQTGPVFPWRVEGEFLVIGHNPEYERFQLISASERKIQVRRVSGQVVSFRVLRT